MNLVFEWDRRKARINVQKHGISFEEAKTIFNDPLLLTYPDHLHLKDKARYISLGYSIQAQLLLVIHTEKEEKAKIRIRIISSRKATRKERKNYENPDT